MIPNLIPVNPTSTLPSLFQQLNIAALLQQNGLVKRSGMSALAVFQAIFMAIFNGCANINELSASSFSSEIGCARDTLYRFMRNPQYDWLKLQFDLAKKALQRMQSVKKPAKNDVPTLAIDDTFMARKSSIKSELIANCYDHANKVYCYGMFSLQALYSDGIHTLPVLTQLVSGKNRLCESHRVADPTSPAAARRLDALKTKIELALEMCLTVLNNGLPLKYVLCDSWFYSDHLINELAKHGVYSVIRAKSNLTFKLHKNSKKTMSLEKILTSIGRRPCGEEVISYCTAYNSKGTKLQLVFVNHNRFKVDGAYDDEITEGNAPKFICIVTNDTKISPDLVVNLYRRRWKIEINFKTQKQHLSLASGCQSTDFNSFYAFTVMASIRYIFLECYRVLSGQTLSQLDMLRKIKETLVFTRHYKYICLAGALIYAQIRDQRLIPYENEAKLKASITNVMGIMASLLEIGKKEGAYIFNNIIEDVMSNPQSFSPNSKISLGL